MTFQILVQTESSKFDEIITIFLFTLVSQNSLEEQVLPVRVAKVAEEVLPAQVGEDGVSVGESPGAEVAGRVAAPGGGGVVGVALALVGRKLLSRVQSPLGGEGLNALGADVAVEELVRESPFSIIFSCKI